MAGLSTVILPARRILAPHLERLRRSIENLADEVREVIARTVGRSISDAVHDAVQIVLDGRSSRLPGPGPRYQQRHDWWDEPGFGESECDDRRDNDRDDEDLDEEGAGPSRFVTAVAAGLQATAWWLRSSTSRFPGLTAAGAGLTAGLASFFGNGAIAGTIAAGIGLVALISTF